jgi:ABC-type Fe3+ transport system substrate-binding protein
MKRRNVSLCLLHLLLVIAVMAMTAAPVRAASVVLVASSFPKELLSAYKRAFDRSSSEYRVEFVNFPGTNIVSYLGDRAPGSRPDVFWSSSPDGFRALLRHDLLQPAGDARNPDIPAQIGQIKLNEAGDHYLGQAISGYGIMWNTRYLEARGIAPPRGWEDLAKPEYHGHIVMSSPSRSSTTHLIVESILQGFGWDDGWSLILEIAGNCATITERSFDVPNSIARGRFGLGPVVDFLAFSGKYTGYPVDFTHARPSILTPVSIGLIKGARNPAGGRAFIRFALSEEGQRLLLRPEISRLPVLPSAYAAQDRLSAYPHLSDVANSDLPAYAPDISESRYRMVGAIFDQLVTFRHGELVAISEEIHELEQRLREAPQAEARRAVVAARNLVFQAPMAEDDELLTRKTPWTRAGIAAIAVREAEWARRTEINTAQARALLATARRLAGDRQ